MTPLVIHPGKGVGPVTLGMRPADVLAALQEEQVYEAWMGGNLNDALLFHGLRLHFDRCDAHAPLPDSQLHRIVVHQREDAILYNQPMTSWAKNDIYQRLLEEGHAPRAPANGDVDVPGVVGLSFDARGLVSWLEIELD